MGTIRDLFCVARSLAFAAKQICYSSCKVKLAEPCRRQYSHFLLVYKHIMYIIPISKRCFIPSNLATGDWNYHIISIGYVDIISARVKHRLQR